MRALHCTFFPMSANFEIHSTSSYGFRRFSALLKTYFIQRNYFAFIIYALRAILCHSILRKMTAKPLETPTDYLVPYAAPLLRHKRQTREFSPQIAENVSQKTCNPTTTECSSAKPKSVLSSTLALDYMKSGMTTSTH